MLRSCGLGSQAGAKKQRVQQGESSGAVAGRRRGPLQIKDLVDAGIIVPGRQKVGVLYKGTSYKADLEEDGSIVYEGISLNTIEGYPRISLRFPLIHH